MSLALVKITVAYSNAVLVAVLPHLTTLSGTLDLPITKPITMSQVAHFRVSQWEDSVGGEIRLTNNFVFFFGNGHVAGFEALNNNPFFATASLDKYPDQIFPPYVGKDEMTTNEAIEFAHEMFYKLGYRKENFIVNGPPKKWQGPMNVKGIGHIPYCEMEWDSPDSEIYRLRGLNYYVQFDIDMQHKQIVGMTSHGDCFSRPNLKIAVKLEVETNYERAGPIGSLVKRLNSESIYETPAYSNATLTVILPYVAEFGRKLNLPVPQPLTKQQVLLFKPPLYYTNEGFRCVVMLTNHYWFSCFAGYIDKFGSPDDWFFENQTTTNWPTLDQATMTKSEATELASNSICQLGFKPDDFNLNESPEFKMATANNGKCYAYCRIDWSSPDADTDDNTRYYVQFDIDMMRRQVVGSELISKKFWRPLPQISNPPELQSNSKKNPNSKMYFRTNAPPILPQKYFLTMTTNLSNVAYFQRRSFYPPQHMGTNRIHYPRIHIEIKPE